VKSIIRVRGGGRRLVCSCFSWIKKVVLGGFVRLRSLYLQNTPFFNRIRSDLVDLNSDPPNQEGHPTYTQPSHEPVKPAFKAGIGTPRLDQNQTSQGERGNRSSLVRHLIWLRNTKGLQVKVWDGVSPGLYCLLCMKNQLLKHPVIVRLSNVCIPNLPVPHHLPRQDTLRRWHNRPWIPCLRWFLISHIDLVNTSIMCIIY
jgi:hypothetical protein